MAPDGSYLAMVGVTNHSTTLLALPPPPSGTFLTLYKKGSVSPLLEQDRGNLFKVTEQIHYFIH